MKIWLLLIEFKYKFILELKGNLRKLGKKKLLKTLQKSNCYDSFQLE